MFKLPCMMMPETCLPPWYCSPRHYTIHPQHTGPRWWNSCWIQWGYHPSKGSGVVKGTFPATSGHTQSTRVYHKSTCTPWRASTPHWETAETSPDSAAMLNLQACKWTHKHSNATVHRYPMCYKITNLTTSLLQDIPTFDWKDTTTLEDWLNDIETAADILKESCASLVRPNLVAWPTPLFTRHFKPWRTGMISVIYTVWNSIMQTYPPTHHDL